MQRTINFCYRKYDLVFFFNSDPCQSHLSCSWVYLQWHSTMVWLFNWNILCTFLWVLMKPILLSEVKFWMDYFSLITKTFSIII